MLITCDECQLERNEPFCPVCTVPRLQRSAGEYSPRFDGIDAVAELDLETAGREARTRLKDGDTRDLVQLLGSEGL